MIDLDINKETDIMNWEECRKKFIRNVEIDKERIKAIIKKAKQRLERARATAITLENVPFVAHN